VDAAGPATSLTDAEIGLLNPLAINCIRKINVAGTVVWGARTMQGGDAHSSQWKYVPVRRLALFIEESIYSGTQWVAFEPNGEALWAHVRLNVGAFLHSLFREGAFHGSKSSEAYFVKCDESTTTPSDVQRGVVNFVLGFAPMKPAEFVVIKFQLLAGAQH
jgi:phage tail sheath protein FI